LPQSCDKNKKGTLGHISSRPLFSRGDQGMMSPVQKQSIREIPMAIIRSESDLAEVASLLAGNDVSMTAEERQLRLKSPPHFDSRFVAATRRLIVEGGDPLGESFCQLRNPDVRRTVGATYTPLPIVGNMVTWAAGETTPARIVDPGAGSGRFLFAAARRFPQAKLVAIETDPLARLMLRANAAVLGFTERLTIDSTDYRQIELPNLDGPTLFIGNPPYVRHHAIPEHWKTWFAKTAAAYGFKASKLAGLHVHFFLKTRQLAREGDCGIFITSAEWLDVNYGGLLRKLLADGLGGAAVHVLAPNITPFADALTTGAITCFRIGRKSTGLVMRSVESLNELNEMKVGKTVPWADLAGAIRWSPLIRATPKAPDGFIELGDLFSVHRGQVTGANDVWIAENYTGDLPPHFLRPTVTKARELLAAGAALDSVAALRRVIDLPFDLDFLCAADRKKVERFLSWARQRGADRSYVAQHRRAWWSVALYEPAPVLCTYMARRPPAFVRNLCHARHLNIAHGLYPREPIGESMLTAIITWLRMHLTIHGGRTYAGGLTKFEPRELERVLIPRPENVQTELKANDDFKYVQNASNMG
jgi:hypothetical protein